MTNAIMKFRGQFLKKCTRGSVVRLHAIGEAALATGARRHLVQERGVPKRHVDFVGYWRQGRAATS